MSWYAPVMGANDGVCATKSVVGGHGCGKINLNVSLFAHIKKAGQGV